MKLPIIEQPFITTHNYLAHLGSVLLADEKHLPFYLSNFTQIETNESLKLTFSFEVWFNRPSIFECGTLATNIFDKRFTKEMFLYALEDGRYVHSHVDNYYIPERKQYKNEHELDDVLIYGFDEKCFYTISHNINDVYQPQTIDIEVFMDSIVDFDYETFTDFFKPSENMMKTFDFNLFQRELQGYVNSCDGAGNTPIEKLLGLNAQSSFIKYFDNVSETNKDLDLRIFQIIFEHKRLMVKRLEYLENEFHDWSFDFSSYEKVFRLSGELLNLCEKYNSNRSNQILMQAAKILNELQEIESKVANNLLDYLVTYTQGKGNLL